MESDFGIQGYLTDFSGFACVLKQRYQDFLVNEIDSHGSVVHLTELDAVGPSDRAVEVETSRQKQPHSDLWPNETEEQLKALEDGKRNQPVSIECKDFDKSKRTNIHNAIRERFPNLQSATCNDANGSQIITVTKAGSKQQSRKRRHWPSDRNGDYIRFVLYKENKDSHFASSLIGRLLGLKANSIALAGTKDRRGVTTQLATIYRIPAERLAALNSQLKGIKLGNFEYCENQLFLGDSKGNRFTVVMRNIQMDRALIEEAIRKWSERGFINFYGTQRFGTSAVATHTVGKAILRKQWAEVVDLLLHPRDDESDDMADCCRIWASTKDPVQALDVIPARKRHTCLEGHLLLGLKKYGLKDFANAFSNVPRNSRTLYIHGLQSFVWNKLISKRVAKYEQKLLVGDTISPMNDKEQLHTLSAEDVEITDAFKLHMPLPSAGAKFMNEEISQWFDDLLLEEGVTRDDFKNAEKDYAVHGDTRQVFVQPANVEYQFFQYNDPTVPLVLSDYDRLQGKAAPETVPDGKYLALSLSFSLPPGSYATMAIRELCHMDTGKQYQSTLNDYGESKTD